MIGYSLSIIVLRTRAYINVYLGGEGALVARRVKSSPDFILTLNVKSNMAIHLARHHRFVVPLELLLLQLSAAR